MLLSHFRVPHVQCLNLSCSFAAFLQDGTISVKELPSFAYKTTLGADLNQGHHDAVRRITTGPSNTFFSTGNDRKMIAWQITGDANSIQSK